MKSELDEVLDDLRMQRAKIPQANDDSYVIQNGCKMHDDCFTCIFPDCIISEASPKYTEEESREMARERSRKRKKRLNVLKNK